MNIIRNIIIYSKRKEKQRKKILGIRIRIFYRKMYIINSVEKKKIRIIRSSAKNIVFVYTKLFFLSISEQANGGNSDLIRKRIYCKRKKNSLFPLYIYFIQADSPYIVIIIISLSTDEQTLDGYERSHSSVGRSFARQKFSF